ncbi:DNA-protecting protein DprA [Cryobacterium sp. LW097]|uniref:DNA-processing protein DprA n=1 Tax=unclassified Cryobacterium TaxID=2649013 RepID=UPI000B4C53E8|nr:MULTISPECIES: DNA-processing protein DprA [unclassified Cryobacterium]ASD22408.1 DNA-protecting protein DprA [Cryobacterium sp. LW097]TFC57379.1 DNA-protecting protein DprA [Cryobacterium sp. TMB1-7]TFC58141.1 DNA-protecting protein DprA [Cryobacterium sp. TMB3-1-2]TFC71198.1 DNA-protecting protein DprA [Cryobacterium sp. TMB3-15]TFC79309.1 DNA-protecting protein DprA [Cryobacterium sp. TMB3-10]
MTLFGIDEAVVTSLTAGVRPAAAAPGEEQPADARPADAELTSARLSDLGEVFARAAWTTIAEPGDGVAGAVVGLLGAAAALRSVVEAWPPDRLAGTLTDSVGEHEASDPSGLRPELEQALARWRPRLSSTEVIRSLQQARRTGTALLLPNDPLWPRAVDDLGRHAPLALWWRGQPDALAALRHSIALVGARAATGYGEHVAMEAAAGLVDRGLAIVSGAAYGIDGMAHRSALASNGATVAFLAGGVDRFYPSGHDALLTRIVEAGAVLSELPCGAPPTKWRFLQRNRLIAASSAATVVLEAGWRSGSLNTAGHAAALGRPLGAVPGPVTSPTSAGCHRLLRDYDAICVTSAADMAELIGLGVDLELDVPGTAGRDAEGTVPRERTSDQVRVFDALSVRAPRVAADIARRSGLSTVAVLGALGTLDLEGSVRERATGWVRVT